MKPVSRMTRSEVLRHQALSAIVPALAISPATLTARHSRPEVNGETWVMIAASLDPPTVQILGIVGGRYTVVKREAVRRSNGRSTLVLGTHQSTATMGKLVGDWIIELRIPPEYHEPFVQALGRALSKAFGHGGDDVVSTPTPDLVPGTQGSEADGDAG